jgi:hypothetical protein
VSRVGEEQATSDEAELVNRLTAFAQDQEPIETTLRTDARG